MPIVAVPTTYAGSEMTPVLGITEGGVKRTRRDQRMLPRTVIYDPELTFSLPAAVSGPSGMNAIAHCVEALYAVDANPLTSLLAEEGIRALAASLPVVVREPSTSRRAPRPSTAPGSAARRSPRSAWRCTTSSATCSAAVSICPTPRCTRSCCRTRPRTTARAAPAAMARIARALGAEDAAGGLFDLAAALGAKQSLAEFGLRASDLIAPPTSPSQSPYPNPTPLTRAGIRALLDGTRSTARAGRRLKRARGMPLLNLTMKSVLRHLIIEVWLAASRSWPAPFVILETPATWGYFQKHHHGAISIRWLRLSDLDLGLPQLRTGARERVRAAVLVHGNLIKRAFVTPILSRTR